jgi:hypothetical protein
MSKAVDFLNEMLGPMSMHVRSAATLYRMARKRRISDRSLRRAATKLGLVRYWNEDRGVTWCSPSAFTPETYRKICKIGLTKYLNNSRRDWVI